MPLRVIIADDHRLILEALKHALDEDDGFEVVAETDSGAHILPLVNRHRPDLVLTDIRMPGMDGLTALDRIRADYPAVKVVIVSASTDQDEIQAALRRGAVGYIVKSIQPSDLPAALRQAYDGTAFYSPGGGDTAEQHVSREAGLTEREVTILKAVARGLSNKEISQELWVTEQTVKFHLSNLYRKLEVANRAGAMRYAMEHGLAPAHDA